MNKSNGAGKWSIVIIVAVVVIVVVIIAVVALGNHAAAPTTAQNGTQPPSASAASYTSPNDGFAVNFPGTPQVTTTMYNSMTAGSLPLTVYKEVASGTSPNAYYAVMVYHYPASYQFPDNYLMGALQVFGMTVNAKYPGTAIANQTPMQFLGAPALSATVTIPVSGATNDDYVLITTKGQSTYIITTYAMPQSDYASFLNSFTFTQ